MIASTRNDHALSEPIKPRAGPADRVPRRGIRDRTFKTLDHLTIGHFAFVTHERSVAGEQPPLRPALGQQPSRQCRTIAAGRPVRDSLTQPRPEPIERGAAWNRASNRQRSGVESQ